MLFEFRSVRAVGLGVARRVLLNNAGVVSQTIVGLQRPISKHYPDHFGASQPLLCVNAFHPFILLHNWVLLARAGLNSVL